MHTIEPRPIAAVRLDGGRLCLNFVNTIHDRGASVAEDYIATPQRFLQWSLRAGAIDPAAAGHWPAAGRQRHALHGDVGRFRNHLHALFTALIDGTPVPAPALRELDRWAHRAWRNLHVDAAAPGWLRRERARPAYHGPLEAIALSALAVLRDADPSRLRRCQAPNACGWLFYDDTRNGSRRWCSMTNCGALFKTRRYRLRRRARRARERALP